MRRAAALALLVAGCKLLLGDPDRIIALEILGPIKYTVPVDDTLQLAARARAANGDTVIGAVCFIQDGAVLHTTPFWPTVVGNECTIGHLAHLEACTVEDGALVGSGAVVLHRALIGSQALVGAGAVVSGDTVVPPRAMALGVPAKIRPDSVDTEHLRIGMESYVARAVRYRDELRRVD